MRTLIALLLLCPVVTSTVCFAADTPATTTWRHGDKDSKFGEGLGTQFEGLVVAMLGNCASESGDTVATPERWKESLKKDHLRVQFATPRAFGVTGEPPVVEAEEILIPISASDSPDRIFVRTGKTYRAFAKFDYKIGGFIQERLKELQR